MRRLALTLLLLCTSAIAQDAVPFPKPIIIGEIEATPALARVSEIPLKGLFGSTSSKDQHFIIAIKLRNSTSTKRIEFEGWPEKDSIFVNYKMTDEHGNTYKPVSFGLGTRPAGDEGGETIEPGGSRVAVVVAEKPIPLASTLTIDLDGKALGYEGKRLKWTVTRTDWEPPPQPKSEPEPKRLAAPKPEPKPPPLREWKSADGKFSVRASFLSMGAGNVKLRKPDDSEITVPIEKLSDADRKWLEDYRRSK